MKEELIYTILDLEAWNQRATCRFCSGLKKAFCQIRTHNKVTQSIVENNYVCESCKEKFENDEFPKCENCGRLKTEININALSGKYICNCVRNNESQQKELPILLHEERPNAFYERQINGLREELAIAEEALEIEKEEIVKFHEKSKEWSENQKKELLDWVKQLETEVEKLKKQTPQELINELYSCRKKIKILEEQNSQLTAQIEVKETKKWSWLKVKSN